MSYWEEDVDELAARLLVAAWASLPDEELIPSPHERPRRHSSRRMMVREAEQAFEMAELFVALREKRRGRG
jgi:hypothetical protein